MKNVRDEVQKMDPKHIMELRAQWSRDPGLGANPSSLAGDPVSFTAHLDSILPGVTMPLSTSGLANGFRTPYVIDEIRMQAYMTTPAASAAVVQPSTAIAFQFRTGSYAFSQVPVSMILHQPVYYGIDAVLRSAFTGDVETIGDEARWVLPKPLWMAPGDQIQCSVKRDLTIASGGSIPFAVDVTYVGRSLRPGMPGPRVRCVPWIAQYIHDFSNLWSSTTDQFRNPFMQPLMVQKLIGRPLSKATTGNLRNARTGMLPNKIGDKYVGIYIEDSLGYKITRTAIAGKFSPVGSVFGSEKCMWTFSRPLAGQEQLNMQFQTLGAVAAVDRIFGVSMIGYREEA